MKISNSSIHNLIKFNYLTKNFRLHDNFYQRKGAMGLIAISIFRKEEERGGSAQLAGVKRRGGGRQR